MAGVLAGEAQVEPVVIAERVVVRPVEAKGREPVRNTADRLAFQRHAILVLGDGFEGEVGGQILRQQMRHVAEQLE